MTYLGDFRTGKTVRFAWNSNAIAGESITRATNGTISVYKDGNTTQSTTGVTDTEDFDSLTGVHLVAIDTSADGTFYSAGSDFLVVLSAATIDGKTINAVLFGFSLEARSHLMPTTDGRKLDVSAGGEAGVDWANVGSPTTTLDLSGTTIKTATDIATAVDAVDNFVDTEVAAIKTVVDAIQAKTDNLPSDPADASVIAGRFDTVDGALTTIDDFLDTEVAAIKAKTDNLPADPADASDIAASFTALTAKVDAIDDYVDTEVAAIKAKTDLIPGTTDGMTFADKVTLMAAVLLGKASGLDTATAVYRAIDDSKDRVTATVDASGNRSAVTLDAA